ncbi:Agenet-like domain [Sesbania bispinosa]|nr:Agenet-like domain [Sesbania bispinosa]
MCPPARRVDFSVGDKVEVSINEEGFWGSYYEGTIVSPLDENGCYMVRYKNLLEDDRSKPLTEPILPKYLRPKPPHVRVEEYKVYSYVNAFANDGWWFGRITRQKSESHYYVYFKITNEEIPYHISRIRVHQEWG